MTKIIKISDKRYLTPKKLYISLSYSLFQSSLKTSFIICIMNCPFIKIVKREKIDEFNYD